MPARLRMASSSACLNFQKKWILFLFFGKSFYVFLSIRHVLRYSSDFKRYSLITLLGGCGTPPVH
jgi:hypothetical protein